MRKIIFILFTIVIYSCTFDNIKSEEVYILEFFIDDYIPERIGTNRYNFKDFVVCNIENRSVRYLKDFIPYNQELLDSMFLTIHKGNASSFLDFDSDPAFSSIERRIDCDFRKSKRMLFNDNDPKFCVISLSERYRRRLEPIYGNFLVAHCRGFSTFLYIEYEEHNGNFRIIKTTNLTARNVVF